MVDTFDTIEDTGSLRSDVSQLTEEAVQRVQAQGKQAKQIAKQTKKDKAIKYQLAQFLSFLLQEISNENLIKAITDTFFKTVNPKNHAVYLKKEINIYVIVGFFAPFFIQKLNELKMLGCYEKLGLEKAKNSIADYISYLGQLSNTYHDNIPIDQASLVTLIVLIIQEFFPKNLNLTQEQIQKEVLKVLPK